jgi:hypothetical protein
MFERKETGGWKIVAERGGRGQHQRGSRPWTRAATSCEGRRLCHALHKAVPSSYTDRLAIAAETLNDEGVALYRRSSARPLRSWVPATRPFRCTETVGCPSREPSGRNDAGYLQRVHAGGDLQHDPAVLCSQGWS